MNIKLNLKRTIFKTFYNVFYTDGLMKKSDLGLEVRNTKWRKRDLQARDVPAWWCGTVVGGPSPGPGGIACEGDEWNESRSDNIRSHAVRRDPAQGGPVQGVKGLRACGHGRARRWMRPCLVDPNPMLCLEVRTLMSFFIFVIGTALGIETGYFFIVTFEIRNPLFSFWTF